MKQILERISASLGADDRHDAKDFPSRSGRLWNEQGEHWNSKASSPMRAGAEEPTVPPAVFDFSQTEIVRNPRRNLDTVAVRTDARKAVFAEQQRGQRAQNIARFLEVNNTVQGGHGFAYRVIQAVRGVSADYDLWKGPTKRVTFLLG
jgi:hypothetical protein